MKLLTKFQSYTTAALTASATSIAVASVTDIPSVPFKALLDAGHDNQEQVIVTAVATATKTLTIVRGQGGSTAVAHNSKTLLYHSEIVEADIGKSGRNLNLIYTEETGAGTYIDAYGINITMTTQVPASSYFDALFVGIVGGTGGIASGGVMYLLWVDVNGGGTNSGLFYLARFSVQSGSMIPNAYLQFQSASPGVEHLFRLAGNFAPWADGGTDCTASGATDPRGTVAIQEPDGTTVYIRCWDAK